MKQLNTLPIEDFLDRTRIAIKGNQQSVTLTIREATDLQNSLSVVMTRLSGELDQLASRSSPANSLEVKMDGGKF
jgi:hypothetical protein